MPTGYTRKIGDGISFEEFAMGCADLCEYEPSVSDYNLEQIKKTEAELMAIKAISLPEAEVAAKADYDNKIKIYEKLIKEAVDLEEAYEKMLDKAEGWQPPTPKHRHLKEFMIEQIEVSVKHDCGTLHYKDELAKVILWPGCEWRKDKIKRLTKDLAENRKENQKEVSQVKERKAWLQKLRESLH